MEHANRSAHTHRAYATDLASFIRFHHDPASAITTEVLRSFFATIAHLAPATRVRKEAAVASFLAWVYRHDLIPADPMGKLDRVRLEPPTPRGLHPDEVEAILAGIGTFRPWESRSGISGFNRRRAFRTASRCNATSSIPQR